MVCERSGDPDKSHKKKGYVYKGKTNRKNKTFSKKIHCPFKLAFNYNEDKSGWVLYKVMQGCHNHPRPEHLEGHFMAAKLTPKEMDKAAKMRTMGISPLQMLQIIKEDNKDNHSSLSTIYNAIETIRRKEWRDRKVMQQLFFFAQDKNAVQKDVDSEGEIKQLFIAHPTSVQLAQLFYEDLITDCIYKTNKYEIPLLNIVGRTLTKSPFTVTFCFFRDEQEPSYIWALNQAKAIFRGEDIPGVIVRDNDVALMNAIEEFFPQAHNMICTFHTWCNLVNRYKKIICPPKKKRYEEIKMLPEHERADAKEELEKQYEENYAKWVAFNGEWESLCWSITEEEYHLNLAEFIAHSYTPDYPGVVSYVLRQLLEPYKEKFVNAYTNQYKHLGNQATSLIESAHHRLKKNLFGCVDNFLTVWNAMENYFKRDVERIKENF